MKILLLSVLAVATIGLMIPSAFASEHSTTSTPEAIKEMMEQREKFRCLTESIVHTWKDGECITKPEWYTSNQTNWSVPKAETPKHIKELVVNLGFKLFEDTLLNQEALKRDIIHEDLDKSSLFATEQMYERFNAWYKNIKFLQDAKDQIRHNFELLSQTDWKGKEKDDFIKICNHSKESATNSDLYLRNKFNF